MRIEIWQAAIAAFAAGWIGVAVGWFIHSLVVADWGADTDHSIIEDAERN